MGGPHGGMLDTRDKGVALCVKKDGAAKTMATKRALIGRGQIQVLTGQVLRFSGLQF